MTYQSGPKRGPSQSAPAGARSLRDIVEEMLPATQPSWSTLDKRCLVAAAQQIGRQLAGFTGGTTDIGTSQVRNIYQEFVRIRMLRERDCADRETLDSLELVKPRIAYAAGRVGKPQFKDFSEALTLAIDRVLAESPETSSKALDSLLEFVEAVVQYMTYYKKFQGR